MCGIAGILRFDENETTNEDLNLILNKMEHRGQDYYGIKRVAKLILGHRRLSIIDLNDAAAQPMSYENLYCVCYNGEIYNYLELKEELQKHGFTFNTESDTEVLLAAYACWGQSCLEHFNGMFAFALWDDKNKFLFCARDQLGIKPFYYIKTSSYFAFASEAYALAHLNQNRLNSQAIFSYILSMYVTTTESIFANIFKLSPGHSLIINQKGQLHKKRFWDIDCQANKTADPHAIEDIDYKIRQSIRMQIRSDVRVGGFLSGGVDSGLITAMAAPLVRNYHTYSVGYEGMDENELPFAHEIAMRYGTTHRQLTVTADDAMSNLNSALRNMSEPLADPALVATYMLSQLAKMDGVKVLLNGTGGDEVFAGYTRYTGQLSFKRRMLMTLPQKIKRAASILPLSARTKARLRHVSLDMLFATGGSFDLANEYSKQHSKPFFKALKELTDDFQLPKITQLEVLYQQMLFDLHVYLPDELLFLLDQMTMAHTIEGRVPLLDIEIIKAAFSFKANAHIVQGQTKAILKQVALPYLGKNHVNRKKQGFAGSPLWWVKHNHPEFMMVIADLRQLDFFKYLNIDRYDRSNLLTPTMANEMFLLYCFSKWHERLNNN